MYFKYTSEFANKFINLESPLQVYFRVQRQIHKFRKPTSRILLSFQNKYINESQVYF